MSNTDETFLREIDPDNAMKAMGFEPMTDEEEVNNNTIEKFYSLIREWANIDYITAKLAIESIKEKAEKNINSMDETLLEFCIAHNTDCSSIEKFMSHFGYEIDDIVVTEEYEESDEYIAIEQDFSLLMNAAYTGNIDTVVSLLKSGVDIYQKNENGDTALSLALKKWYKDWKEEYFDIANILIKYCGGKGFDDLNGFYDLIYAAKDGNKELVTKLIKAGMFLNFQTDNGYTALMESIIKKHDSIVMTLLNAGANPDIPTTGSGTYKFTPLGWAASQGNFKLVEKFIFLNADLDILDNMQHSPLIDAIGKGHQNVAISLIDAGASPNIHSISLMEYDVNGQYKKTYTALMLAAANGYKEIVTKLLNAGADVDFQNSNGYTALMWSIENGYVEVAQELILAGANIDLSTLDGKTVINMLK